MSDSTKERLDQLASRSELSRRDLILAVSDELYRAGKPVTEAAVLAITGGSASTVHRYVREWKDQAALRDKAPEVPTAILQSLNDMFSTLHEDARAAFEPRESELLEEIQTLTEKVSSRDEELARRDDVEAGLAGQIEQLQQRNATLEEQLAVQQGRADQLASNLSDMESANEKLTEAITSVEQSKADLEQKLLTAHKEELDRMEAVYVRAENRLFQQNSELKQQVEALSKPKSDDRERNQRFRLPRSGRGPVF